MIAEHKNWNDTSKLMDVHDITKRDDECLKEIQEVIERHNLTSKFGVALLHKHFAVEEGEILIESNDPKNRVLTTKPVKFHTEISEKDYATTVWRFDNGVRYGCFYCAKNHCD